MAKPTLHELLKNRNDQTKKSDRFYVKFFAINENVGNYLGTQVKSINRPEVTIDTIKHQRKGAEYSDTGALRFSDLRITLSDDEESLTSMLLYAQMLRQKKRYAGEFDHIFASNTLRQFQDGETYKFGIQVEMLNSRTEVTEGYIYRDCFITSISHSQNMYDTATSNDITITLSYDNIDMRILDEYFPMTT